jgi:hypothetical protein
MRCSRARCDRIQAFQRLRCKGARRERPRPDMTWRNQTRLPGATPAAQDWSDEMASLSKSAIGISCAALLAALPAPALAGGWRRHYNDDAYWAVGAGLLGLGLGAAIAAGPGYRAPIGGFYRGYYGRRYYPAAYPYRPIYGYYGTHFYPTRAYAYPPPLPPACYGQWVWDPYWQRHVRMRVCN